MHFVPLLLTHSRSTLLSDRLVKIYVGKQPEPYLVQEVTLRSISDYFFRALRHEASLSGEKGVLSFPEDNRDAWDVLLYWKFYELLEYGHIEHPDSKMKLLVECWVIGDKYDIELFQDDVMWELIKMIETRAPKLDTIKLAFDNTTAASPPRNLMAEELLSFMENEGKVDRSDLDLFDGVFGFSAVLMCAIDRKDKEGCLATLRARIYEPKKREAFMVGAGPKKYWDRQT